MKLHEKIGKKDLVYWNIILILAIIVLLTKYIGGNGNVVDYFSFAGTITSILLAAIAIFYSFIQNFANEEASKSLILSVKKIEDVTNNLQKVGNLEEVLYTLEQSISSKLELTRRDIKEIKDLNSLSFSNVENSRGLDVSSIHLTKESLRKVIIGFNEFTADATYFLYKCNMININAKVEDYLSWYVKEVRKKNIMQDYPYMFGVFACTIFLLQRFGVVSYYWDDDDFIKDVILNDEAKAVIAELIESKSFSNHIYIDGYFQSLGN